MTSQKNIFHDTSLDLFLVQWTEGKISPTELSQWKKILSTRSDIREDFCDWVKSLRRIQLPLRPSEGKDH